MRRNERYKLLKCAIIHSRLRRDQFVTLRGVNPVKQMSHPKLQVKITVVWVMTPCSSIHRYERFGETGLLQSTVHPVTGHKGPEKEQSYSSTLSLTSGLYTGTHCIGGWVGLRAGLDRCGKSRPTGIRSPDRPARSESLQRLSYPGSHLLAPSALNIYYITCQIPYKLQVLQEENVQGSSLNPRICRSRRLNGTLAANARACWCSYKCGTSPATSGLHLCVSRV